MHFRRTFLYFSQKPLQPVYVQGFPQGVAHCLAHQQVVGDFNVRPSGVVLTGCQRWKHGSHHIVCFHALDLGRVALAAFEAQHGESPVQVPSPACAENGGGQHGLLQHFLGCAACDISCDLFQREAVLRAERQHDGIVIGCCLQFKVKSAAKALSQCQAEAPIDAAASGIMDD